MRWRAYLQRLGIVSITRNLERVYPVPQCGRIHLRVWDSGSKAGIVAIDGGTRTRQHPPHLLGDWFDCRPYAVPSQLIREGPTVQ